MPLTILSGLILGGSEVVVGNELSHFLICSRSAITIIFGIDLYGTSWKTDLDLSLMVLIDCSIMGACSPFAQMCNLAGISICLYS